MLDGLANVLLVLANVLLVLVNVLQARIELLRSVNIPQYQQELAYTTFYFK